MKKLSIIVLALLIIASPIGCKKSKHSAETQEPKAPAAKAKQKIETPTLEMKDAASKPQTAASASPMQQPEAKPRKDVMPGAPLETPPIPSDSQTAEKETALSPTTAPASTTEGAQTAQPQGPEQLAFQPSPVTRPMSIDVILDASGSMNAPFGSAGFTKFELAKRAIEDVLIAAGGQKDIQRDLGLRLFGSQKPLAAADCTDTLLLDPITALDVNRISSSLKNVTPQGMSPIAVALAATQSDFPASTIRERIVVLIADGADTCGQNPCDTAAQLSQGPNRAIVQVIGFDVSSEDQAQLSCIASQGGGSFFLARNEAELKGAIDSALNATIPYNLRLTVTSGPSPIPATITVMNAGTSQIAAKELSFGTKVFKLRPGNYDILIEYTSSPEKRPPSKIIKGVQVLEKTKVEQSINFDLGEIMLSAVDEKQNPVPAHYKIVKSGTSTAVAELETGADKKSFIISPGTYDITTTLIGPTAESLILTEEEVQISAGTIIEKTFLFQNGTLAINGETTQKKPIPFIYQAFPAGRTDQIIASGAVAADGGSLSLPPGTYDLVATGQDPSLPVDPRTKVTNIPIKAAETTDLTVNFEMGELSLLAVDDKDSPINADFSIQDVATGMEIAKITAESAPATISIPPGKYTITAYNLAGTVDPKPSIVMDDVEVTAMTPLSKTAKFVLGSIRVRGTDSKEAAVTTQFTLYKGGTDEVYAVSKPTTDWVVFDVPPGIYDMKAVNTGAASEEKPFVMLRNLSIETGKTISHQSIFTAGKIKIIGRGPNNKIINVGFKIFEYGADRELVNGKTADDWAVFEIPPGRYYLEASFVDPDLSVLLKKWVNVTIGENEVVEQVLRF